MSRNGSGTYTIPNTYSDGQTETAAIFNTNFSDIGAEITNSLALDGQSIMTGQIKAANGSASAPSFTFGSDLNTGMYRKGADNVGLAAGGTEVLDITATGASITGTLDISGAVTFTTPIATASIADSAITTAKIADANVTSAKLAAGAVTTAAITDASVTTAKIADANVTLAKLANLADGKVLANYSGSASAPSAYSFNQINPLYHVREQQSQNTASSNSPTSGAWRTVVLNADVTNEITGASRSSNTLTLPAGTYWCDAVYTICQPGFSQKFQLRLENTSDSALLLTGQGYISNSSGAGPQAMIVLSGRFTLAVSKTVELQVQTSQNNGAAAALNFGPEVYVDLKFWKVA